MITRVPGGWAALNATADAQRSVSVGRILNRWPLRAELAAQLGVCPPRHLMKNEVPRLGLAPVRRRLSLLPSRLPSETPDRICAWALSAAAAPRRRRTVARVRSAGDSSSFDVTVERAVPYGHGKVLDVYLPRRIEASAGPEPVVLLWHGVGADERDVLEPLARATAALGLMVFVPDWRSDAADGGRAHLLSSVSFTRQQAPLLGGNADAIVLAGWSRAAKRQPGSRSARRLYAAGARWQLPVLLLDSAPPRLPQEHPPPPTWHKDTSRRCRSGWCTAPGIPW